MHLLSARRIYSAHRYTARTATQCAPMLSAQRCKWQRQTFDTVFGRGSKPSVGEAQPQREAGNRWRQPPTTEPSPSQEKPSAAASGGTAQRSTKHCQCSNDSKRFTGCARLHLLSAQRIYSVYRYTARTATQCAALYSAQRYTVCSATQCAALHSAQRFAAPSASLRPALHCAQRFTAPSASLRLALHCA